MLFIITVHVRQDVYAVLTLCHAEFLMFCVLCVVQCFGLLGVNGAGKTTTFRMLTGDTSPTLGHALIHGKSVQERGVVQRAVGYCPQVDALVDQLSGRQHLTLYARLRGIPRSKVSRGVVVLVHSIMQTAKSMYYSKCVQVCRRRQAKHEP